MAPHILAGLAYTALLGAPVGVYLITVTSDLFELQRTSDEIAHYRALEFHAHYVHSS